MEKRYPRGMIYSTNGWSGLGENIDLTPNGVMWMAEDDDITNFAPYTSIDRIRYETIPQEILDEARANSAKNDSKQEG